MIIYWAQQQQLLTFGPEFDGSQCHSEGLGIGDKMQYFIGDSAACTRPQTTQHWTIHTG